MQIRVKYNTCMRRETDYKQCNMYKFLFIIIYRLNIINISRKNKK